MTEGATGGRTADGGHIKEDYGNDGLTTRADPNGYTASEAGDEQPVEVSSKD